jgi:hypothetical protein
MSIKESSHPYSVYQYQPFIVSASLNIIFLINVDVTEFERYYICLILPASYITSTGTQSSAEVRERVELHT